MSQLASEGFLFNPLTKAPTQGSLFVCRLELSIGGGVPGRLVTLSDEINIIKAAGAI